MNFVRALIKLDTDQKIKPFGSNLSLILEGTVIFQQMHHTFTSVDLHFFFFLKYKLWEELDSANLNFIVYQIAATIPMGIKDIVF
jgi:hypothetical protein